MGLFWTVLVDKSGSKQVRMKIIKKESIRKEESKEGRKGSRKLSKHTNKQFI